MVFSEVVGTLSFLQPQADDDMADRLHYYYTTTFLLVTSVLISLKMYGGRPIECWMPAEYQSSWQEYTEIYCFSMNTYFAPFDDAIPSDSDVRYKNMISYYQWTPFFLVICAFMFYSPCLIWRVLYTKSGIRIKDIIAFANDRSNIQPKMREANVKGMSAHLGSVFRHRFRFGSSHPYQQKFLRILNLRFYEAYLTCLYICIKVLFLINVTIQMFLMNWFLQTSSYRYYGFGVLEDLIYGRPWSDSGNFPRITYCDMDVRVLGNVQKHTVQCVLVINIFIEKVFVLLWIWYTLLLLVTVFSLCNWILSSFPFEARKKFIARRLELANVEFKRCDYETELEEFVRDFIKMDGVFMLRMLTIHAGILVCTEVVDAMWDDFIESTGLSPKSVPMSSSDGAIAGGGGGVPAPPDALDGSIVSQPARRKTSVLVPLVSAQPNGMNQAGFLFQSMTGHHTGHHTPQQHHHYQPQQQQCGVAAVGGGAIPGAVTAATDTQKGDFQLKKPPNPQQWRKSRQHSASTSAKGSTPDLDRVGVNGGTTPGSAGPRMRRPTNALPFLGAALASLRTTQRSQSIQESPALWEVEENAGLMKELQSDDEMMEEETASGKKKQLEENASSTSTWHASSGGNRK